MDNYLYDLLFSKDVNEILKFYDNMQTPIDVVKFLKNIPNEPKRNILTVEGDTDIVIVVPTLDFNRNYAKHCRQIFKGQQMIFLESKDKIPHKFFNYGKTLNMGLNYALRYKPKWVIFCSDDVYKIDEFKKLKYQLQSNESNCDMLFTRKPHVYHSVPLQVCYNTDLLKRYHKFKGGLIKKHQDIMDKFNSELAVVSFNGLNLLQISIYKSLFFKTMGSFYNCGSFGILNPSFIKKRKKIFDETYLNGYDDIDLSIDICIKRKNYSFVDFKLGDFIGKTLGTGPERKSRDLINYIYFNYKNQKYFDEKYT